jgi:WD40 repeat protein
VQRKAYDAFVSFAQPDRNWVHGFLLPALTASGISWCTLDSYPIGMPELESMSRAIESADRVILVLSPAQMGDQGQQLVGLLAQHFGTEQLTWPVIPILIHPIHDLPLRLRLLNPLDALTPASARQAVGRLCTDLGRPLPDDVIAPACPFPGMRPYEEGDQARFHGRTEEIDATLAHLRLNPYLFLVGASGSGKSSLIKAGVMPRLRQAGRVIVLTRPGVDPLTTLTGALDEVRLVQQRGGSAVLVVDQLEEIFTTPAASPDVAVEYWRRLSSTLTPETRLAATVRADFYPQLMASPMWVAVRDHRLEVVPLTGDQLRACIVRPAEDVGVYIETTLVERLTDDADRQPGSLPFVQETLVLLWDRLEYRFLPMSAYEALVMPRSRYGEPPRTGLQVAMANRADAVMAALPSDDARRIARRVFLRLVQFVDGRDDVRRQQPRTALASADDDPAVLTLTLDRLVATHLLTATADPADPADPASRLDLSHEALIVGWPALRQWIAQRRAAESTRRELAAAAANWRRLGGLDGGLLDDIELREAERWLAGADAQELGVEADVEALIAASRRAVEDARRRRIRSERVLRSLTVGLALLLAASAVLGLTARRQRDRARVERATAQSGELALTAAGLPGNALDRALLLSLEAVRLRSTPRSLGSVLTALRLNPRVVLSHPVDSGLTTVAASGDGQLLAVGDDHGTIRLLRSDTLAEAVPPFRVPGEIRSLAFSPDEALLAAATSAGSVQQWRVATGAPEGGPLMSSARSIRAVRYSPDGRWIAAGGVDGPIVLIDRRSGARRGLKGHRDWVNALAFSSDSERLFSAGGASEHSSKDGRVLVWDTSSGHLVRELPDQGDAVRDLALTRDGRTLAAAGADGRVRVWQVDTGRLAKTLTGHADRVFGVAFTADGSRLLSVGRDGLVRVWDVASGHEAMPALNGHGTAVRDVAVVPGSGTVVTVGGDARVLVWDIGERLPARLARTIDDPDLPVRAVAVDAAKGLAATGDDTGQITVGPVQDGPMIASFDTGIQPVWSAAFAPDGRLVTTTSTGTVQAWDARSGRPVAGPVETGSVAAVVAVSPAGLVATGGWDGAVQFWDANLRPLGRGSPGHLKPVQALAFRASDGALLSAGFDARLLLWDRLPARAGDPAPVRHLVAENTAALMSLALSPDGATAATGDLDGAILLWDTHAVQATRTGRPALVGHTKAVTAVAYSADGRSLLSADAAGVTRLWDTSTGPREVGMLGQQDGAEEGAVIGSRFVVGTERGVVSWDLEPAGWARISCGVAGRNLRPSEQKDDLGRTTYAPTCPDLPPPPSAVSAPPLDGQ